VAIGRLHIVAIASLGTFTFGWIFTGERPWLLAAVCAVDWFVVNLLNRVVDLREDALNRIPGVAFVARHRRAVLATGFTVLAVSLAAVHVIEPSITALRLGYHALGLAYNWPLLPGGRRIKQLYLLKNVASATGFMITVFGYPLAAAGWSAGLAADVTLASVAFAAGFFFLFELSYEVIYDLRDVEGDAAAGVASFAVVHGPRRAVRIVDGLIAASLAVFVVGYAVGDVPWRLFIMFAAPLIQLAVYKAMLRRGIGSGDCVSLTWLGAALLLVYHGWELLGLPGA
jgi:4-hydroxybenzoate polyprenyltransferase